ncbi:MAG: tetratricopeptide repeat protein [Terracidiphilus sp.]
MKLLWKIFALVFACVVTIAGWGIVWHLMQLKTQATQAEDARATKLRADRGDAKAEYELGGMYYHGEGVPQDYAKALDWSRKAAEQGYPAAYSAIGSHYEFGQGVAQDYAEAVRWYRKGADKGFAASEDELGRMYYRGHGVTQDYAGAFLWCQKAADQGDADGENRIAYMYHKGQGVKQDDAAAIRWYRKAADQGQAEGESSLGFMYYYGYGVRADRAEAYRWFRRATDQGDEYALRALSKRLTTLTRISLGTRFLLGIFFSFSFLSLNFWERGESPRDPRRRVIVGTGIVCLFSAGLSWYGYTHYQIRCLACGLNAFTGIKWLLDGVLLGLLFYIVLSQKTAVDKADTSNMDSGNESHAQELR